MPAQVSTCRSSEIHLRIGTFDPAFRALRSSNSGAAMPSRARHDSGVRRSFRAQQSTTEAPASAIQCGAHVVGRRGRRSRSGTAPRISASISIERERILPQHPGARLERGGLRPARGSPVIGRRRRSTRTSMLSADADQVFRPPSQDATPCGDKEIEHRVSRAAHARAARDPPAPARPRTRGQRLDQRVGDRTDTSRTGSQPAEQLRARLEDDFPAQRASFETQRV